MIDYTCICGNTFKSKGLIKVSEDWELLGHSVLVKCMKCGHVQLVTYNYNKVEVIK